MPDLDLGLPLGLGEFVSLPLRPAGVYLLINLGQVVYVGQSKDIFARIAKHRITMMKYRRGQHRVNSAKSLAENRVILFDEVKVLFAEIHELDRLEIQLIERFSPRYNIRLKRKHAFEVDLDSLGFDPTKWTPKAVRLKNGLVRI